jgi:hypothetical protein
VPPPRWDELTADEGGLARFVRCLTQLRRSHGMLGVKHWVSEQDLTWHSEKVRVRPTASAPHTAIHTTHAPYTRIPPPPLYPCMHHPHAQPRDAKRTSLQLQDKNTRL